MCCISCTFFKDLFFNLFFLDWILLIVGFYCSCRIYFFSQNISKMCLYKELHKTIETMKGTDSVLLTEVTDLCSFSSSRRSTCETMSPFQRQFLYTATLGKFRSK